MTTGMDKRDGADVDDARLRAIVDAAVDAIIVIDGAGHIEVFNNGAERIFGYPAESVLGRNVSVLMPAPDRHQHDTYIANYLQGGPPRIIGIGREVLGQRRNGEIFPMELSVGDASSPAGTRFVGIVKDISARRETETALAASERRHRILFDNAPVGIFTADVDGRFLDLNSSLRNLLGYAATAELAALSCASVTVDEDLEAIESTLRQLRNGESESATCRVAWLGAQGVTMVVDLRLTIVAEGADGPFLIGHVVDRTEETEAAAALQFARQQVAQAGRVTTLGEMASAIAHEINQPLTAISAYAQACKRLLDSAQVDEQTMRDSFESIYTQSMRAGEVVHRIRSFVRDRESVRKHESVNEIIESSIALAEFDVHESGVRIACELTPGLPAVQADRVQIQQVCLNLIRNAIDALVTASEASPRILIVSGATGDGIEVSVADNGPGIPDELRETLFQPFRTTREQGMGMGLSISHSIIAAHHGQLSYAAGVDGGAIFTFALPAAGTADD